MIKPGKQLSPNTVAFRVPLNMNKLQIKNYLEQIYMVSVKRVRTLVCLGKKHVIPGARRIYVQKDPDFKKAYVTVAPEDFVIRGLKGYY